MLKTRNFGAYRDLLVLFTRYGRKDFKLNLTPDEFLSPEETTAEMEPDVRARAEAFAESLRNMGPAYIKFGQLLSTRPDIVPAEYIIALEKLQDDVGPFSFAEVERIVEEELGVRISKAFEVFESTPMATASLGQVHKAVLRDGREVVVKVQRPDVREQVRKDLQVFTEIAESLEAHTELGRKLNLVSSIEQARMAMLGELNYVQEARNTETIRANLASFPQIHVPGVIHDLSSSRVLTTELVKGKKVSKLTPLSLVEGNYAELASVLTRAYLKQVCVDGFWHSDPHPGNVFIRETPDTGAPQLVLLDFGMCARISTELQDEIIKLLLSISTNKGAETAQACIRMSERQEQFEEAKFTREISTIVAAVHDATASDINTGQLIFQVVNIANSNDLRVPPELALLGKTLLHLDSITKRLDDDYDPKRVISDYSEQLMAQKLTQKFNPQNFYPALLDLNQLVLDLPHRTREILDQTAGGKLTFGFKFAQAEEFLAGIQKVANRISVGTIVAALLISSSLLMRVETRFRIAGYPGLAMLGYIAAAAVAFYLVISILMSDRRDRERTRMKGK